MSSSETTRIEIPVNGNSTTVSREEYEKVLERLKQSEAEKMKLIVDHNNLMREFNKRMQTHIEEIRLLKDVNQGLQQDIQELRDLSCYLDDDRQKCRKLAREWQRFGRYTAAVMQSEVSSYQEKIKSLEERQESVGKDNTELKELCLYLDKRRDDICSKCSRTLENGDAKSETKDEHEFYSRGMAKVRSELASAAKEGNDSFHSKSNKPQQGIKPAPVTEPKSLPNGHLKVNGVSNGKKRVSFHVPGEETCSSDSEDGKIKTKPPRPPNGIKDHMHHSILKNGFKDPSKVPFPDNGTVNPDAVSQAMQVLQIHEKLDKQSPDGKSEELNEKEVAVLKEMCNVVWRKLSDDDPEMSDEEVFEDLL